MKRILVAVLLCASAVNAQGYLHRSNSAGGVPNVLFPSQCIQFPAGAANTAVIQIGGTWTGTLSFIKSNDPNFTTSTLHALSTVMLDPVTGKAGTTQFTATTITGTFIANMLAFQGLEVCSDPAWTGNATVRIDVDPGDGVKPVSGPNGEPVSTSAAVQATAVTPSCGTSPCAVGASSVTVLAASVARHGCKLQNVGTVDLLCNTLGGTASASSYDVALGAASHANGGDGGFYRCDDAGGVNPNAVACIGVSGGASLAVSAR
ncbi:hypothetical protein [Pseudomonas sp.]|uniref:hypothetical protein n=1 Tax=Pseudomonas sp. TaxID=306 RepID=UPI00262739DC|nr:hypothetical protein [Pseudomonas sp.]